MKAIFKKWWFKKKEIDYVLKPCFIDISDGALRIYHPISLSKYDNELVVNDNKSLMLDSKIKIDYQSLMIKSFISLSYSFYYQKMTNSNIILNKLFRNEFNREIRFAINSKKTARYLDNDLKLYLDLSVTLFNEQKTFEILIFYDDFKNIVNPYFELKDDEQFYNIKISPIKYYKLLEKLENSCIIMPKQ